MFSLSLVGFTVAIGETGFVGSRFSIIAAKLFALIIATGSFNLSLINVAMLLGCLIVSLSRHFKGIWRAYSNGFSTDWFSSCAGCFNWLGCYELAKDTKN